MRVLSVSFPLMPVGPDASGGAEQILSLLERGLVEAGHHSVVVAANGSEAAGELIPTSAVPSTITGGDRVAAQQEHREAIQRALRTGDIDLIHFHGLDFHQVCTGNRRADAGHSASAARLVSPGGL